MKIALFVPCIVNHFSPQIAIDTLQLLEKLGHQVFYPKGQTCCGQILTNSGCTAQAQGSVDALTKALLSEPCDVIVGPAASCVLAAKENIELLQSAQDAQQLTPKIYELTEFLHDVCPIDSPMKAISKSVSMQMSCHGLRMLHLASASELTTEKPFNKFANILSLIPELDIRQPSRDECCGFGGTFCIDESDVSGKMARDKVSAHVATGAQAIVAYDPSCMTSLQGIIDRNGTALEVLHISALLNQAL